MRFVVCLTLMGLTAHALAAQKPAAVPDWSDFTRLFDAYAEASTIVGGSALVMHEGEVLARHHYGFADRTGGRPVNDNTLFHWGSITKTLTAIAVLQLRDRGLLDLDDPVTHWVPELRRVHNPYGSMDDVTVRMLLAHSAGFQAPTWPWTEGRDWEPFEPTTWEQLVAMMPYQQLMFAPGSRYSYSNPGYIYLARIIEQVTGDPWSHYVQKNLFAPLGLTRSYFGTTPYYLAADRSHGYYVERDSTGAFSVVDQGADFDPGITIPNGGWNAPLDDLAAYLAFFIDAPADAEARYGFVLSRATLAEMWTPQVEVRRGDGVEESMGLGFFIRRAGDRTIIGHTGTQGGFRGFLYFDPAKKTAVLLAFNTSHDNPPAAADEAFETMMQAAFRLLD